MVKRWWTAYFNALALKPCYYVDLWTVKAKRIEMCVTNLLSNTFSFYKKVKTLYIIANGAKFEVNS